jgi:hypothetical protein
MPCGLDYTNWIEMGQLLLPWIQCRSQLDNYGVSSIASYFCCEPFTNRQCSWAQEIVSDNNEERALVIATMNLVQGAVSAWLQLIIWKTTDAPKYHKGFITLAVLSVVYMATTLVLRQLQKRQDAQKEK